MITTFNRFTVLTFVLLILALPISIWLFPPAGRIIGITFFLLSFVAACATILAKNKRAYREGKVTRDVFMRNVFLGILGILFAMLLAGFLGSYVARIATATISNGLAKFAVGIVVGLLVGLGVGILVRRVGTFQQRG